jgi:hypothetical protein
MVCALGMARPFSKWKLFMKITVYQLPFTGNRGYFEFIK